MSYTLTPEQLDIISTATTLPPGSLLKVSAVAGASKTFTLIKVAEALSHSAQLYLAYNKAIAEEASSKFPHYVQCKTTHALAHSMVIRNRLNLDGEQSPVAKPYIISTFTYREIKENIEYDDKVALVKHLEGFFLSGKTTTADYFESKGISTKSSTSILVELYFNKMIAKKIPCTHSFYLKMYHILLSTGHIHYDKPFDLIMLDEAGDLNEVTLAIFLALPATLKIMVGDPFQNIYSFNHTINGFKALEDVGVMKTLSQSFRCSTALADRIETFCRRHLDEDFVFKGYDHPNNTIQSEAIISRTNSGLIKHMISLTSSGIKFNLTREAKFIFSDMLTLMNLKPGCKILDQSLKFIQKDVDAYFKNSNGKQTKHKSCLSYINHLHGKEEPSIKVAAITILKYNASTIYDTYKYAKEAEKDTKVYPLTLTTAHSSKG